MSEEIRTVEYYYVDKTEGEKLVTEGKYYFFYGPRRFGKSLFVEPLKQALPRKKELFEGLYLYPDWDCTVTYPVIPIDFGGRNPASNAPEYIENWIK